MKRFLVSTFILLFALDVYAQQNLIQNSYSRDQVTSLNGEWKYIVDPYENGYYNNRYEAFDKMDKPPKSAFFLDATQDSKTELLEYNFDTSEDIMVPGDWNSQDERLFYYEGTVWYRKKFDFEPKDDKRYFLRFGAVNYEAEVYLNGQKLGKHIGGFTPFQFEITKTILEGSNSLVVKVDNKRTADGVPTLNTDWWNYGGITRDVNIIAVERAFIRDYMVQLDNVDPSRIAGFVKLDGLNVGNQMVTLSIPELGITNNLRSDGNGIAKFNIKADRIQNWSPDNPKRYEVRIKFSEDEVIDKIGFRSISTKDDEILLNGNPIFLKGISIHEENPLRGGRAYSLDDASLILGWAKELGCNFVRLAHYPHNQHMVRKAEELGLLVWSEIPVYWTIDWMNAETYANAEAQLSDMINRDKNRAAVIIWSVGNETPVSDARNTFMVNLVKKAKSLDPTRLISAAQEQSSLPNDPNTRTIEDPLSEAVDILSFNQYIGWYDGLPDKARQINWQIDIEKPVFISEFGAGAKYGFHADSLTRFSEEYQAYLYRETLVMVNRIDQLAGFSPWILVDFRSPRRPLPEIQDGWNRKGLISDKGDKKQAFYVLKDFFLGMD